jgi:hypothetical protein
MIKPAHIAAEAAKGLGLASLAGALSCALAFGAFHRAYYLGALLPLAIVLYLLVAWLLHLRGQGFMRSGREEGKRSASSGATESERSMSHNAPPMADYFAPRDGRIVPRSGDEVHASGRREKGYPGSAARELVWAAAWLALASALLYRFAGVGASYFN